MSVTSEASSEIRLCLARPGAQHPHRLQGRLDGRLENRGSRCRARTASRPGAATSATRAAVPARPQLLSRRPREAGRRSLSMASAISRRSWKSALRATRSLTIVGWDFHSRTELHHGIAGVPGDAGRLPELPGEAPAAAQYPRCSRGTTRCSFPRAASSRRSTVSDGARIGGCAFVTTITIPSARPSIRSSSSSTARLAFCGGLDLDPQPLGHQRARGR